MEKRRPAAGARRRNLQNDAARTYSELRVDGRVHRKVALFCARRLDVPHDVKVLSEKSRSSFTTAAFQQVQQFEVFLALLRQSRPVEMRAIFDDSAQPVLPTDCIEQEAVSGAGNDHLVKLRTDLKQPHS